MKLIPAIQKGSTWKTLLILTVVFLFLFGFLMEQFPIGLNHLTAINGGIEPLDTDTFSADEVYPRLTGMNPEGLRFYRAVLLTTDMFFPALFRILLITAFSFGLKAMFKPESRWHLLCLVPLSSLTADVIENSLISVMITAMPDRIPFLPSIVAFITPYKWYSNYIEWVIGGIILLSALIFSLTQKYASKSSTTISTAERAKGAKK